MCSFVRKLVRDLREEIAHDQDLTDEDRTRLKISTIHTLARSLVERGGGTAAHPMQRHVQVIAGEWEGVVWDDVLLFRPESSREVFSRSQLVLQFHTEELDDAPDWIFLREVYGTLSQFYNAVGFADMIGVRGWYEWKPDPGVRWYLSPSRGQIAPPRPPEFGRPGGERAGQQREAHVDARVGDVLVALG